jgi:predicted molibdopterin-dependent oxidoreductase YjgC
MPENSAALVTIWVNGHAMQVAEGTMVASVLVQRDIPCRVSADGVPRTALCGMGICFECRAVIDGVTHRRTCQTLCREGMCVETQS